MNEKEAPRGLAALTAGTMDKALGNEASLGTSRFVQAWKSVRR